MISVIVPVYNVEKYLDQCVQSILSQTHFNFELILVDDGSTDNSGSMCDEYAKQDNRIRVIHKENGGLSDARNKGTEVAKGDYISYIDSDDYVSFDYLETLNYLLEEYKGDIAVTGICRFVDGEVPKVAYWKNKEECFAGKKALENVLYQNRMDTSACALLVKKEIALSHPFPFGKYHEDDFTTYKYYLDAKKVVVINKDQYFYRQRKGSIMHSFGKPNLDELEASDNLVSEMAKVHEDLYKAAHSKKFSNYCQALISNAEIKNTNPQQYIRIVEYINAIKGSIFLNRKCRLKNRVASAMCFAGVWPLIMIGKMKRK